MKNIDINKIVVSNRVSFGKKGFNYFIGYRDAKIRPYVYFSQKLLHIEGTLMKLDICLFWLKMMIIKLEKYNEIGRRLKIVLRKNLIVN